MCDIAPGEGVSEDLLRKAEGAVEALAADYRAWIANDIATLERLIGVLQAGAAPDLAPVARIHDILHNMKGNGATFGYDLVTRIAASASQLTKDRDGAMPVEAGWLDALCQHVRALSIVVDKRITGPGGEVGQRLLQRLDGLAAPYAPRRAC